MSPPGRAVGQTGLPQGALPKNEDSMKCPVFWVLKTGHLLESCVFDSVRERKWRDQPKMRNSIKCPIWVSWVSWADLPQGATAEHEPVSSWKGGRANRPSARDRFPTRFPARFQVPGSRFQVPGSRFQVPDSRFQIPDCDTSCVGPRKESQRRVESMRAGLPRDSVPARPRHGRSAHPCRHSPTLRSSR